MIEAGVIDLLKRSVEPHARRVGSAFVVEYGKPFKMVATAVWTLTLAISAIALHPSTNIEPLAISLIIGGFLTVALYLHTEFFMVRILFNEAGLAVHGRWGAPKRFAWQDVEAVCLSTLSQNYLVTCKNGRTFTFNYFMSGYVSLFEELQGRSRQSS
jgi:hypothetical protein